MTTYMLHVGLHPDHVGNLDSDNDHWEQWGEERPAGEAVHAYVEVPTPENGLFTLYAILCGEAELVPMQWDNQKGTIAVVTPSEDWSTAIYVLLQGSEE